MAVARLSTPAPRDSQLLDGLLDAVWMERARSLREAFADSFELRNLPSPLQARLVEAFARSPATAASCARQLPYGELLGDARREAIAREMCEAWAAHAGRARLSREGMHALLDTPVFAGAGFPFPTFGAAVWEWFADTMTDEAQDACVRGAIRRAMEALLRRGVPPELVLRVIAAIE